LVRVNKGVDMNKMFTVILLFISFASFAEEPTEPKNVQMAPTEQSTTNKPFLQKKECHLDDKAEGRGCCSHHDGVCGCAGGRAQCCDGALSPSCGC